MYPASSELLARSPKRVIAEYLQRLTFSCARRRPSFLTPPTSTQRIVYQQKQPKHVAHVCSLNLPCAILLHLVCSCCLSSHLSHPLLFCTLSILSHLPLLCLPPSFHHLSSPYCQTPCLLSLSFSPPPSPLHILLDCRSFS